MTAWTSAWRTAAPPAPGTVRSFPQEDSEDGPDHFRTVRLQRSFSLIRCSSFARSGALGAGPGLFKSIDGGATWSRSGSMLKLASTGEALEEP